MKFLELVLLRMNILYRGLGQRTGMGYANYSSYLRGIPLQESWHVYVPWFSKKTLIQVGRPKCGPVLCTYSITILYTHKYRLQEAKSTGKVLAYKVGLQRLIDVKICCIESIRNSMIDDSIKTISRISANAVVTKCGNSIASEKKGTNVKTA